MPTATPLRSSPSASRRLGAPGNLRLRRLPQAASFRPAGLVAVLMLGLLPALSGCDDLGGRQMPMTKQPAGGPGPDAAAASGQPRSGSASTLGKARDSAVKVGDRVDDYNRKIEQAAEEVGK